jgi:ribosomal protein L7/L12
MGLINCPECGKEISDKASACIHCGFPLEQKDKLYKLVLLNIKGNYVMTLKLIRDITGYGLQEAKNLINNLPGVIIDGVFLEEVENYKNQFNNIGSLTKIEDSTVTDRDEVLTKIKERKRQNAEALKELQQKQTTKWVYNEVPKCPTCKSTNVEKISVGKKAFGGAMFGLFSSDVRNTMHCKNCGCKW